MIEDTVHESATDSELATESLLGRFGVNRARADFAVDTAAGLVFLETMPVEVAA